MTLNSNNNDGSGAKTDSQIPNSESHLTNTSSNYEVQSLQNDNENMPNDKSTSGAQQPQYENSDIVKQSLNEEQKVCNEPKRQSGAIDGGLIGQNSKNNPGYENTGSISTVV